MAARVDGDFDASALAVSERVGEQNMDGLLNPLLVAARGDGWTGAELDRAARACRFTAGARDVTSDASWSTDNAHTATVNKSGVLVGVNDGVTKITVTYEGATGTEECIVMP
jgi:hypothetical protein